MSDKFHPLVSIVIPVYNGANYMREAIDSALAQTYDNCEVIVVNDGSDDNGATAAIATSYNDRIVYLEKENGGVATALNMGIENMRGEYFSWLSHDDLYFSHKIEYQIAFLQELGRRDVVLYSDYLCVNSQNQAQYEVRMDHLLLTKKSLYAIFRGCLHGCTLLIPRKAFHTAGLFNLLPTTQDYDMWNRLIRIYPFIHMPNILVRFRLHPEQTSRIIYASEEVNTLWVRLMEQITLEELAQLNLTPKEFFIDMLPFLHERGCEDAYSYALKKIIELDDSAQLSPLDCFIKAAFVVRIGLWRYAVQWQYRLHHLKISAKTALKRSFLRPYATSVKNFFSRGRNFFVRYCRLLFWNLYFAEKLLVGCLRTSQLPPPTHIFKKGKDSFPLVSVIIPTYNRAHSLPFALDSLQRQSYNNIEVIIVDDGSTDETSKICTGFAEKWQGKLICLHNDVNIGASVSRNRGIESAHGEYFTFLDSDDDYVPEKITKQIKALQNTPKAGLCFTNYITTYDKRTYVKAKLFRRMPWKGFIPRKDLYPEFLHPQFAWFVTPSIMLRRDILLQAGGFEASMRCCEDVDLWARILQHHDAVLVNEPLVRITLRDEAPRYLEWVQGRHQLYMRLALRDASVPQEILYGWYMYLADNYAARLKEPSPEVLAFFTGLFDAFRLPFEEMQITLTHLLQTAQRNFY